MSYNNYIGAQAGQSPEDYNSPVHPSQLVAREDSDETPIDDVATEDLINYLNNLPPGADPCNPDSPDYDAALCEAVQAAGIDLSVVPADGQQAPSEQQYAPSDYAPVEEYAEEPPPSGMPPPSAGPAPAGAPGGGTAAPYAPSGQTPYAGPSPYTNTDPQGGQFSTTPTPYTDDQGYPTDAQGNPSDAYGNPLGADGRPMDSNGNPLPTDANGNADPSQLGPQEPMAPTEPIAPGPQDSYQANCEQLVFPVPASRIPTGELLTADETGRLAQRAMVYDQSGPLGTVGIIPMPKVPGMDVPAYAIVALNLFVEDPSTGLLSYLAFADLSGAAARIYSLSCGGKYGKDCTFLKDAPGVVEAIRAACPQFMDLQDLIVSRQIPGFDTGQIVDASRVQIPGWNWQMVDDQGGLVDEFGNPVDEYGNPLDMEYQAAKKKIPTMKGEYVYGDYVVMGAGKVVPRVTPLRKGPGKLSTGGKSTDATGKKKGSGKKMPKALPGVKIPAKIKGYFTKRKNKTKSPKMADAAKRAHAAIQAERNRQKSIHTMINPAFAPEYPGMNKPKAGEKSLEGLKKWREERRKARNAPSNTRVYVPQAPSNTRVATSLRAATQAVASVAPQVTTRQTPRPGRR